MKNKISYTRLQCILLIGLLCLASVVNGQAFKFAHVTDTHIGGNTAEEDLIRTVADINQQADIKFVIVSGDITEFGSDEELHLSKRLLDRLTVPYHVVPGNHDTNWSESGGDTFLRVFGSDTFSFTFNGYLFVGTNSGPNMRMSPGQVPRENLVWMDSLFSAEPDLPMIFINHYPLTDALNNWYEVIDRLKKRNVQLALCGHGHANQKLNFEGIPAIMGRSNLRAKDSIGAYNIVSIDSGHAVFQVRVPEKQTQNSWASIELKNHHFKSQTKEWPRPDFSANDRNAHVQVKWKFQDNSDIGAGMAVSNRLMISANTNGEVFALRLADGKKSWTYKSQGKIYSTPAVSGKYVVVGSADGFIYGLRTKDGKERWKFKTDKAVLGSPIIQGNLVYIGGSDGKFRALNLKTGALEWMHEGVRNYMSSTPLFFNNTVYFGSWGNDFYALNAKNGSLKWKWENGFPNRMLSAAAVVPVAANGRIFIVAPDRYMTALDAETGEIIWRAKEEKIRVRESMGLSADGTLVYVKTMDGDLLGISTTANKMDVQWISTLKLPYELAPSAISENKGLVFVPSHSGLVSAVDAVSGELVSQYKISNAMVNPIAPFGKRNVLASSMDGSIYCLEFDYE